MPAGSLIALPSYPPAGAPQSVDAVVVSITTENTNPFTGQQQIYDWQAQYLQYRVNLPPMSYSNFQAWIVFLKALNGQANYFEFGAALSTSYPNDFPSGAFWRQV